MSRPLLFLRNGPQNDSLYLDPSSPNSIHPAALLGYNIFFARVTQGSNHSQVLTSHTPQSEEFTI